MHSLIPRGIDWPHQAYIKKKKQKKSNIIVREIDRRLIQLIDMKQRIISLYCCTPEAVFNKFGMNKILIHVSFNSRFTMETNVSTESTIKCVGSTFMN